MMNRAKLFTSQDYLSLGQAFIYRLTPASASFHSASPSSQPATTPFGASSSPLGTGTPSSRPAPSSSDMYWLAMPSSAVSIEVVSLDGLAEGEQTASSLDFEEVDMLVSTAIYVAAAD